jgi:hypothetical protein
MATVTATAPVHTGATAGAPASQGASDPASGTGFGEMLAALVPGATAGAAGSTTTAPTPSGVCGAGPEVSVSPDDAVVGAADAGPVVVGATGDDATGSRTGDPGTGTAAKTTDGTDATASEPTPDPVLGVDAALLAQAQLAALPLLTVATADATVAPGTDLLAPVGDSVAAGAPGTTTGATAVAGPVPGADGTTTDNGTDDGTGSGTGSGAEQEPASDGAVPLADAGWQPVATTSATASAITSATTSDATSSPASTAALDAAAATSATAPMTPTTARSETRPADAVPGQVFPEVVRLSQSGPGTHRLTLRLDPGTLGEVRVTLTVRDGEVQVRLAAQHDAREVLAQAAPDLRRLLEQSGSIDARVAVADLESGTTTDLSGGAWDRDRGTDAGTDPEADRRPGSYDGSPRGSVGHRSESDPAPAGGRDPGVRLRPGLDLAL